ncbi:hypothetical protein GQ600_21736 [Phytophthora cactorum]|nr:hypothetical protein GQ600_21736 [Phytophthora cactorum]
MDMDTASGHKVEECKDILKTKNMRVKFYRLTQRIYANQQILSSSRRLKYVTSEWDKEKLRLAQEQCFSAGKGKKKASVWIVIRLNGLWQESQLFEHLQAIVQKYRDDFDGNRTE